MNNELTQDKKIKEKLYTVYMHVNKENNKKYIGITSQNVYKRWQNGYGYKTNPYFWRSIEKHGWDNFDHIILYEGLSERDAKNTEIRLIQQYNTKQPNGYNLTDGGDNVSNKLHSIETRQKISNALKGRKLTEEQKNKIKKAISGKNNPFYGKKWTEEHRNKIKESKKNYKPSEETRKKMSESRKNEKSKCAKKVYQYCLDGTFVKEWFSASMAARELKLSQGNISAVCRGERNQCGEYMWRFYKEEKIEPFKKYNYKKIAQKTLDGKPIKIFDSIYIAAKELNLDCSSIVKCCKGKYKTCGGFIFEYIN